MTKVRRCYECSVDMELNKTEWVWYCPQCGALQKYYPGELAALEREIARRSRED